MKKKPSDGGDKKPRKVKSEEKSSPRGKPIPEKRRKSKGKAQSKGKKRDLFADLWDRPKYEVESELKELVRRKTVAEQEIEAVRGERQRQIRIAQAIRGVIVDTKNIRSAHKGIINQIGERENVIKDLRQRRDSINERVVIPLKNIDEELMNTFLQLTEERKDLRYPSVEEELRLFSFFFELQAMRPLAIESNSLHHERIELIEKQREAIKELRQKESEHDEVVQSIQDSDPIIKEIKVTPWEEKSYNRRIAKLFEEQKAKRDELHNIRREAGRLDAFLRVDRKKRERTSKSSGRVVAGSGGKHGRGGRRGPDVEEVRRKAATGESMSLEDLSALLDSGGLDSIKKKHGDSGQKRKRKGSQAKKFSASRGAAKAGRPDRND